MSAWTPEALRRAALEALGSHADERARDVLARSELTTATGIARWQGSGGTIVGHRVALGMDAARLGRCRAVPAVFDALCAAIAAAIASRPGEALHELVLCWSPAVQPAVGVYRDAPPGAHAQSLQDALAAYLEATGEPALAELVASGCVERAERPAAEVRVVLPSTAPALRQGYRRVAALLTCVVRDLLADPAARAVVRSGGQAPSA